MIDKKYVSPGDAIAYIEEFLEGENTYVDGDVIRSMVEGRVDIDWNKRVINVIPLKSPIKIEVGYEVIGSIINISGVFGYVQIEFYSSDRKRWNQLPYKQTAVVYPPYRVTNVDKVYGLRDEIYGIIVSKKNRLLHISIRDKQYGVVKSLCKYCGEIMYVDIEKDTQRKILVCPQCKSIQYKKLSPMYGNAIIKKLLY